MTKDSSASENDQGTYKLEYQDPGGSGFRWRADLRGKTDEKERKNNFV